MNDAARDPARTAQEPSLPSILLIEDDPVSAAFLCQAAALLPARVDHANSLSGALQSSARHRYDLFLVDANLPDGRGETLLAGLREQGRTAPALAHTAAREPSLVAQLMASGFAEVLPKPLGVADLLQALRRHLPAPPLEPTGCGKLPVWDDAAALAAVGGEPANVRALRELFIGELPGQRHRITTACERGDTDKAGDELHRLVASCGFVGAARLGQAVRRLQAAPLDADALQALRFAIEDVLASA